MATIHGHKPDEERSFELLFRKYYLHLCAYANKFIANQQESEEIVQQLFLNVWEKKERFRFDETIRPYLFKSVKNQCLNLIGHRKVTDTYYAVISEVYKNDRDDPGPYDPVVVSELQGRIQHTIALLPDQCRKIFMMSRDDGLKYAQIALALGISVKTVETQMSRALAKLKFELKDYLVTISLMILLK
jgi:RNA polymerase sigma-70 factor (ECF subfamily)